MRTVSFVILNYLSDILQFAGAISEVARKSREQPPRHHVVDVKKETDQDVVVPIVDQPETKPTNLALLYGISRLHTRTW